MTTRPHRIEWLLLGLALLLGGLAVGYSLDANHRDIDRTERDRLQVQARVIEENLGRQIEAVDQALRTVQAALDPAQAGSIEPNESRLLTVLRRTIPGVRTLVHVGPDGTVIAASGDDAVGNQHAQQQPFTRAKTRPDALLLQVVEPQLNSNGVWTIALARVLTNPGGEFAGVVQAALAPEYLDVVLRSVLYAPDMRVVLMHGDGRLFLNVPANDSTLGTNVDRLGSFFRRHRDSGAQASLLSGTTLAGEARMAAVRSLRRDDLRMDGPLVIAVGRDTSVMFAPWRTKALVEGGTYTLFAATACLVLRGMQRRQRKHDRLAATHATELAASEARFRSLTRLSSDWYWEQDANLRFVLLVGDFESAMNVPMQEHLGRTRWDTPALNLGDDDWASHRAVLTRRQGFRDFVMARLDAQDGLRWVSVSGEPVFGANGAFCGYRGTGRDITAQMRDKEALRLSEERLQLILRGSNDAPWDLDLQTDQLWLAQRWSTMLGYEWGHRQLTSSLCQELCHPEDAAAVIAVFRRAIKGNAQDYELEMRLRHRDGHYVPMLMRGYILRDDTGRAIRASGVNTDLTEHQRAEADREQLARAQGEQQLRQVELAGAEQARGLAEQHAQGLVTLLAERDRTIGERNQLLGLLAHEVRQPLNNASAAIQGAAMALADPLLSSSAASSRLERAQLVLDQVVSTVNNALSASILLTSAERITTQEIEIDTVIALAVADLGAQARTRVRAQRITRGRTAELNIALVRLALRNLLTNALAYSPADSPVNVRADFSDDPPMLVIDVEDSGDGIAPELLTTLFERGTRGTQAAMVHGSGLGLYVVARVVALHDGRVDVLPSLPCGTVFRMALPQGRLNRHT